MNANFTPEQVILFIYGELSEEQAQLLRKELQTNIQLRDYYEKEVKLFKELDTLFAEPNDTSVQIILEESHSTNLETI